MCLEDLQGCKMVTFTPAGAQPTIFSSFPLPSVMTVRTTHLITNDVTVLSLPLNKKIKRRSSRGERRHPNIQRV